MKTHDPVLSEIVARLVSAVDPEKLILFGSRAKGIGGPDSDYDILIVKGEPDPARRRTGPLYRKLWGIPNAVDLLWYTPQEVEEWAEVRQHVATQAVGHGVVVYEKAADLAAQLLAKAANDLAAARIGLEHEAPLDTVCFHVQQAAEKALESGSRR